MNSVSTLACCLSACLLASCSGFKIDLGTAEAINVDVKMRLDVYQYSDGNSEEEAAAQVKMEEVVERQRNRMEEIQELKNNRIVGETHLGTLLLRTPPAGDYGDYAKKTVAAENQDRVFIMRSVAEKEGRFYHEIQAEQWKKRVDASYKGEWIEVAGENDGTYKWIQKETSP